ncbi:MAG: hypothetical protein EBU90_06500 [Proteobacteria bacterium]|nr:hypothetical protein [Pseudomonadota bacterium]
MRQVIVKKTDKINKEVFNNFSLSFGETTVIKSGLQKIKIENPILVMSGGQVHWQVQLSEDMATSGLVLSGVYFKDEHIVAYVFNTNGQAMEVSAGLPVLELRAYETISVRQIEHDFSNVIIIDREPSKEEEVKELKVEVKEKRKRKGKKKD